MKLAILAEKPAAAAAFSPILREFFSADDLSEAFVCFPILSWYTGKHRYQFPHGLKWGDYPFVGEPVFHKLDLVAARAHRDLQEEVDPATYFADSQKAAVDLTNADKIIVALEPLDTGFHLAAQLLGDYFDEIPWDRVIVIKFRCYAVDEMRDAVRRATGPDDEFFKLVTSVRLRRYFDFNYLVNSFALTGHSVMKEVGLSGQVPSKYGLQLLYAARDWEPVKLGDMYRKLVEWRGTGRYVNNIDGIATEVSRGAILESLESSGFLRVVDRTPEYFDEKLQRMRGGEPILALSPPGHAYLGKLHPSCEDADLPFRLYEWSCLPEEEAKAKIARYIRTFFGKQKNFIDKARKNS